MGEGGWGERKVRGKALGSSRNDLSEKGKVGERGIRVGLVMKRVSRAGCTETLEDSASP